MRGPSLQKTALLSFALHLTAFLLVFLILRQSHYPMVPSPYTVSLVSPEFSTGLDRGRSEELVRETREPSAPPAPAAPAESPKKNKKEVLKEKKMVQDRIAALEAKRRKIDTMGKLREIISLKAVNRSDSGLKSGVPSANKGAISDAYFSKITKEIWDQWNCNPSYCKKGLEAVVSIRILKNGTAIVQGKEKSSGNRLFDRSALAAIEKASPLPPPPHEMEIGVRFYP